jgi:hypothetical protein
MIGVLYDHGVAVTEIVVVAIQVVALALLAPLLRESVRARGGRQAG